MILSLDGQLALIIPNDGTLTVDTSVIVVGQDGEESTGLVSDITKDEVIVKVSMDDFSNGDTVSVKREENDSVVEDQKLITLENTDYTAAYKSLLEKRIALVNQYNRLIEISNTGYVYAESAGTISDVDNSLVVATKNNTNYENVSSASYSSGNYMYSVFNSFLIAFKNENAILGETVSRTVSLVWLDKNNAITDTEYPEEVTVDLKANGVVIDSVVFNAETGWEYTWSGLPKKDAEETYSYSIEVRELEGYSSTARVEDTVTLIIMSPMDNNRDYGMDGLFGNPNEQENSEGDNPFGDMNPEENENIPDNPAGAEENTDGNGDFSGGSFPEGDFSGGFSSGFSGGFSSGASGMQASSEATATQTVSYELEETVLCNITVNDKVSIEITIDELDINKVYVGQQCNVALDAITGQSFTGTIDGENVEIIDGLSANQVVYYRYADSIKVNTGR